MRKFRVVAVHDKVSREGWQIVKVTDDNMNFVNFGVADSLYNLVCNFKSLDVSNSPFVGSKEMKFNNKKSSSGVGHFYTDFNGNNIYVCDNKMEKLGLSQNRIYVKFNKK